MTWEQLSKLLADMVKVKHTALQDPVEVVIDGNTYDVDIIESLHTGKVRFIAAFNGEVEEDDAE